MRERAGRYYSPAAWLLSRLFFDLVPLRLLPALTMSLIMYAMVGLNPSPDHVLKFIVVVVELSFVQTIFNLLLAALAPQSGMAILMASLLNLLQLAFAGFFVNLNTLSPALAWMQYLAPFKYSLEAMSVNEVGLDMLIKVSVWLVDTFDVLTCWVTVWTRAGLMFGVFRSTKPIYYPILRTHYRVSIFKHRRPQSWTFSSGLDPTHIIGQLSRFSDPPPPSCTSYYQPSLDHDNEKCDIDRHFFFGLEPY